MIGSPCTGRTRTQATLGRHSTAAWHVICLSLLIGGAAIACTIPVFRFALDRWQADPFTLVIPESLTNDKKTNDLLRPIRANAPGNLEVKTSSDPSVSMARLDFPSGKRTAWEGSLDSLSLNTLLDSPARQEVLEKILSGASAVWVLVDEGEPGGAAEAKRIRDRLRFLEKAASLPIQDPNDPDSQLGPGPELKLDFELVRVSRSDPAEAVFIEMLRGPAPDPATETEPFVAAVFGRGRALGAWQVADMDNIALEDASMFLVGRCSCQVKQQNPGWDLMMNTDWDRALAKVQSTAQSSTPNAIAAPSRETKSKSKPKSAAPPTPMLNQKGSAADVVEVTTTSPANASTQQLPLPKLSPARIALYSFAGFCALVVLLKCVVPKPKG